MSLNKRSVNFQYVLRTLTKMLILLQAVSHSGKFVFGDCNSAGFAINGKCKLITAMTAGWKLMTFAALVAACMDSLNNSTLNHIAVTEHLVHDPFLLF